MVAMGIRSTFASALSAALVAIVVSAPVSAGAAPAPDRGSSTDAASPAAGRRGIFTVVLIGGALAGLGVATRVQWLRQRWSRRGMPKS
jgi:hypothetical protein